MIKTAFIKGALPIFLFHFPFFFSNNLSANVHDIEPKNIPFEVVKGLIIVQAEVNGENGNFILDTGSPMIILNEKVGSTTSNQANSLGGQLPGEWKRIKEFSWAGIQKFNLEALSMDIDHLELVAGKPLKGLIGYEFFGSFDLLLDFEHQFLMLVPTGVSAKMDGWKLRSEIPFTMEGHLAVIEAKIGDASFRFGLDTGAGVNLLDIGRKDEIAPGLLSAVKNANVIGLGQNANNYMTADISKTIIAGVTYGNMRYILSDISGLQNLADNNVDGLLGFPFFQSGKFTINYASKIISIWQ